MTSKKTVRFEGFVLVQEYLITLGCNPGGSMDGPPITIGWEIVSVETVSLKAYERARRPLIRKSKQERTLLLSGLGFGQDELLEAERQASAIRTSRIESSDDVDDNDDVDDDDVSLLSSSLPSDEFLVVSKADTTATKVVDRQPRPITAKLETHPLDAANHSHSTALLSSSQPLPPPSRKTCANIASFSFQRSSQGTKAMLMFQKRRVVR